MAVTALSDISPNNIPLNAGPNDPFVGLTDDGGSSYKSIIDGSTYTIYPEKTEQRGSYVKAAGEKLKDFGSWFTTPQSLSGINSDVGNFITKTGSALAHGVYDPIERMVTGKGTIGDLNTTVANVAGATVAPKATTGFKADEDALGVFFSAPSKVAKEADYLKRSGFTPEEVLRRTGASEHPKSGWLMETDDSKFTTSPDYIHFAENVSPTGVAIGPVKDAFKHKELYEKVAGLGEMKANVATDLTADLQISRGHKAAFDPSTETIFTRTLSDDATVLHELQHGADKIEGREGGTSPNYLSVKVGKVYGQLNLYGKAYLTALDDLSTAEKAYNYVVKQVEEFKGKPDNFTTVDGETLGQLRSEVSRIADHKSNVEDSVLQLREQYPEFASSLENLFAITKFDKPSEMGYYDLYTRNEGEALANLTADRANLTASERSLNLPAFSDDTWTARELDGALADVQSQIDKANGVEDYKTQLMNLPYDLGLSAKTDPIPRYKKKKFEDNGGPPLEDNEWAHPDLSFQSPLRPFIDSLEFPKDGIKGSQFLKELNDNPTIRTSEWNATGIEIDPAKRYTRKDIIDQLNDHPSSYEILPSGQGYQRYQRQQEVGLRDPEISYQELTINSPNDYNTGDPRFKANYQHYHNGTLAHTRYSVRKDAITGETYLLPEELQSDLVQKGWQKPSKKIDYDKALKKSLYERVIYTCDKRFENTPENLVLRDEYLAALKEYIANSTLEVWENFYKLKLKLKKAYEENVPEIWDDSEVELSWTNYYKSLDESVQIALYKAPNKTFNNPPITKISESVRLLGDAILAKASDLGINKVVFPPIEKIVEARFKNSPSEIAKALNPKSGFYQTYVTSLKKYLDELKQEFGDDVQISQKKMNYTESSPSSARDSQQFWDHIRTVPGLEDAGLGMANPKYELKFLYRAFRNAALRPWSDSSFITDEERGVMSALYSAGYDVGAARTLVEQGGTWADFVSKLKADYFNKINPPENLPVYGIEVDISKLGSKYDLTKPRFAEGGSVENTQNTNPVPPGALPNEVADNVDAKLSEGEYVLPADVVRYLGLDYVEKMVNKAKEGLAKLNAQGRIGGQGPDDLPFSPEELQAHDAQVQAPDQVQAPVKMAKGGSVNSQTPWTISQGGWQVHSDNDIDPATGLPYWMSKQNQPKKEEQPKANPWPNGFDQPLHEKSTFQTPTGLAGSVDQWGPDDFLNYARSKDSGIEKGVESAVGAFVPFGGLAVKARQNYLNRNVPKALDEMLSRGTNKDGTPLSAQQRADLQALKDKMSTTNTTQHSGLFGGIRDAFNGMFHSTVSPTVSTGGGENANKTQSVSSSLSQGTKTAVGDNDKKNFAHGGYVTRRKH